MILVAPTAFKGTLRATDAAAAMARGAQRAAPDAKVREMPVSDGGPGLIDALRRAWGGSVRRVRVAGPVGDPVDARVLLARGHAVVESADACGLHRIPPAKRDPLRTTSRGVGELVAAAAGPDRLVLGLGGSGTVDGGAGMAQALGWSLLDMDGRPIPPGGGGLLELARISRPVEPPALPDVVALADVRNPLLGDEGAAAVFAPQKGADAAGVRRLELGLARLATRIERDLGDDVRGLRGAGAAGGLGAAAVAFLGAELAHGSEWVLRAVGFADALRRAELVVTGEGAYDAQSAMGKVTGEIVALARAAAVPVLLIAGRVDARLPDGVDAITGNGERVTAETIEDRVADRVRRLLA